MVDLNVDTEELRLKASVLKNVRQSVNSAKSSATEIAFAVGHDRLAKHVRDFGSKWDLTRLKLNDRLEFLENSLRAMAETYEDLDKELASSVNDRGAK